MAVTDHGGPDAGGVPMHDFSTNANACGPCPEALAAVQAADASRYPDPAGMHTKAALAAFHGVDPGRVLLLASASEGMQRFSAWTARSPGAQVWLPSHHYADLSRAATAWGLTRTDDARVAQLVWACEPSSPLGQPEPGLTDRVTALQPAQTLVLDLAYEPLRLSGLATPVDAGRVWRLFSPNKALGLTGVRAAYVLAPEGAGDAVQALEALAPSWPVGAHGEALLLAWARIGVQDWLRDSLNRLRAWKTRQMDLCNSLGWKVLPSEANFFCARLPVSDDAECLARLRQAYGVKLRDAASFGLSGHVRLGVLPPAAQDALAEAWAAIQKEH